MVEPAEYEKLAVARFLLKRSAEEARDARALVLELREAGVSRREMAERLEVPAPTLAYWLKLARSERDGVEPRTRVTRGR